MAICTNGSLLLFLSGKDKKHTTSAFYVLFRLSKNPSTVFGVIKI